MESVAPSLLSAVGATPPAAHGGGGNLLAPTSSERKDGLESCVPGQALPQPIRFAHGEVTSWSGDFSDSSSQLFDRRERSRRDPETSPQAGPKAGGGVALPAGLRRCATTAASARSCLQASEEVFSEKERQTLRSLGYL